MREAMSGADWVVHAAAELDFQVPEERMRRINVDGSRNVATLAWKLGVGRFLSVSSMACFGGSPADGTPADESFPPQLPFPSPYSATKFDGQQAIQKVAKKVFGSTLFIPVWSMGHRASGAAPTRCCG